MGFFEEKGYSVTLLVWNKTNAIPLANGTYHSNVEFIVCVREKGCVFIFETGLDPAAGDNCVIKSITYINE